MLCFKLGCRCCRRRSASSSIHCDSSIVCFLAQWAIHLKRRKVISSFVFGGVVFPKFRDVARKLLVEFGSHLCASKLSASLVYHHNVLPPWEAGRRHGTMAGVPSFLLGIPAAPSQERYGRRATFFTDGSGCRSNFAARASKWMLTVNAAAVLEFEASEA
eukprot:578303-Amphidinium_carterae.1